MQVTAGGPPISVSVVVVDPTAAVSHVDPAAAVTRVVPVLQLAYIEIAFTASMDDSGLYQYKTDMAVVVDSTAIAFSRPAADDFSLADASLFALTKGLADSVGTTDVCIPVLVFLRDFTDTLTTTDASVIGYEKNPTDAVVLADAAPTFNVSKALADAFAMNDMADIGDGIAFQFDDYTNNVVTMSDGTVVVTAPAYSDTVAPADSPALAFSQAQTDSVSETDDLAISFAGAYTDATVLTDNLSNSFSQSLTDSFGQSDAVVLNPSLVEADSFTLSDAGSINVQDYVVAGYFAADYVGTNYTF